MSVLIFVIIFINVGHMGPPDNPSFLYQHAFILNHFCPAHRDMLIKSH